MKMHAAVGSGEIGQGGGGGAGGDNIGAADGVTLNKTRELAFLSLRGAQQ